jgi:hypothetical protein
MSHGVLVSCGYDGTTPNELDGRQRDGAKPPSCSVSSSLPVWKRRENKQTPSTHAHQGSSRTEMVDGFSGGRRTPLSLPAGSKDKRCGSPYHECMLASWASAPQPRDRIYDVSCNVCPRGIDASIRCEVGAERSCGRRRTTITLAEVEPHRTRSRGSETQTAVRTGERRFTKLGSTTATATLRRDGCLVNEGVSAALRTTVRPRTLGRIGGVLEKRRGGRSRNGTW